ncbi:hypothetical protein [Wolbachia endosymbiont of Ctenocephalides felis wCfeJ]|uniref:hypothetical protein n=1 Tax=Wolbachia endosymbiont of Ctenocephalides felis wCfeJ TaxID=2732594 RepID=UPI0014463E26|nr:hypothetical protein [Wolbachia endosymbiont of Ctenocephalides felis wCfeJ]
MMISIDITKGADAGTSLFIQIYKIEHQISYFRYSTNQFACSQANFPRSQCQAT